MTRMQKKYEACRRSRSGRESETEDWAHKDGEVDKFSSAFCHTLDLIQYAAVDRGELED
jgi:hypothetical protein